MPTPAKLSRDKILAAAIELLDEEGLGALSMRRIGERLGVEAMSLYRHVRNKAALLDGVHDALLGQMQVEPWGDAPVEDIRRMARAFRRVLARHANALPMFATRAAAGPKALMQVERGLEVLRRAGLRPAEALATFQALFAFVVGHALYTLGPSEAQGDVDYASLPADRFPNLSQLDRVLERRDLEAEFELGLELFIAGLRPRLAGASKGSR